MPVTFTKDVKHEARGCVRSTGPPRRDAALPFRNGPSCWRYCPNCPLLETGLTLWQFSNRASQIQRWENQAQKFPVAT